MADKKPEYIVSDFELKSCNVVKADDGSDNEFLEFEGHGAFFGNIDLQDDIIERGTFASAKARSTKLLLMHDHRSVPVGIFTELKEDQKGLFVSGRLPMSDDRVKGMIEPQMRIGSLNSMSVGFITQDFSFETRGTKRVRIITKAKLFEISLVSFPANPKARITAVKDYLAHIEDETGCKDTGVTDIEVLPKTIVKNLAWDKDNAVKSIRDAMCECDEPGDDYYKGFLYRDVKNADMFNSYKLPIAEKQDGKLVINFRSIVSAVATLAGAKGGIDIPDDEKQQIMCNINRLYEKADETPPFNSKDFTLTIGMAELKYGSKPDIEYLLKHCSFKSNTAKMVVSVLHEKFFENNCDGDGSENKNVENNRDGDQKPIEKFNDTLDEFISKGKNDGR